MKHFTFTQLARTCLLTTFLSISVISTFGASVALAQTPPATSPTGVTGNQNYTVLSPLPGTTDGDCTTYNPTNTGCQASLSKNYLQGIFNLSIGIGAVAAFVMLTFFGFEYMLSDSLNIKTKAKAGLLNAIWGLGFVIFAYAILNTLNPALVNGNLNIAAPVVPVANVVAGGNSGTPCAECTSSLTDAGLNVKPGTGTYATPALTADLKLVSDAFKDIGGITITEGNPPSVDHKDVCHTNGSCVDVKPTIPSATNINAFYATAIKNNLNPSFEVPNAAEAANLKAQGVTIPIKINTDANGDHFHVKLK